MNVWAKTESSPTVCTAKRCHLCSRACRQTQTASFQTHGLNSLCLSPFGFSSEGECVRVCYSVTVFDPAWRGTFNMLYKQHSLPLSVAISSVFSFSLCCLLFFFFILLALLPIFRHTRSASPQSHSASTHRLLWSLRVWEGVCFCALATDVLAFLYAKHLYFLTGSVKL